MSQDPRFANRFGGGGGDGYGGGRGGFGREEQGSRQQQQQQQIDLGPTPEEIAEKEEKEKAKAAKAAARAEADRIAKEAKQKLADEKAAAMAAAKELEQAALSAASTVVATGLKGEALATHIQALTGNNKPTGAALLTEVLAKLADGKSLTWASPTEYGAALSHLVGGKPKEQMAVLFSVQQHCHNVKFPKIDIKGKQHALVQLIFQLLYKNEICDDAGFIAWADDVENEEVPGRLNAVVQTTDFMRMLTEVEEEERDEDEEEDEIDAPRETV